MTGLRLCVSVSVCRQWGSEKTVPNRYDLSPRLKDIVRIFLVAFVLLFLKSYQIE